jgi:Holliday junction DNA helicase RuvB
LTTIVESASILKMPISMEAAIEIAGRRRTPYSKCCLVYVQRIEQWNNRKIARCIKALNVDAHGLDEMDNKILNTIIDKFKGGPVVYLLLLFLKA